MKTRIERTSKKGQRIALQAAKYAYGNRRYTYTDIFHAYKNPSSAKIRAWNNCKELCRKMRGFDLIISAAGCQTFSVVFKYIDKTTGALSYAYITRDYSRFCYAE